MRPPRKLPRAVRLVLLAALFAPLAAATPRAQTGAAPAPPAPAAPPAPPAPGGRSGPLGQSGPPVRRDQPVFYKADSVEYDRDRGLVTLKGHVEFWQGERMLLADQVTYDRNTGVAAARGHVVLLEPGGQTVFADYAELDGGMKDGVLEGMRALLAENARLAANGARRIDGRINELSRVVYSTCNVCQDDPTRPPLWQIRARSAVQDLDNKMIEYRDAELDFLGVPVFWLPFLTHPDPSQKRASGLLTPSFGYTRHLGPFIAQPWYWVIDGQSDATITPMLAGKNGPALGLQYRRRFNDGVVTVDTSLANYDGRPGGHVFAKGKFAIDEVWRWGFDLERASSLNYMRDFRVAGNRSVLTSQAYLEGFGQGAWTRLDMRAYQGLTSNVRAEKLPYVLPRYQYSFFGEPNLLGGRVTFDAGAFNVLRRDGTNTQRANLTAGWQRGLTGPYGDVWNVTVRVAGAAYVAHQFDQQPNFGKVGSVNSTQAMPTAALMLRWPLMRDAGSWGSQLVEPIAQVVVAPRGSSYVNTRIPNEDSLDQEFTDATLFALNRFPGIDRMEGGVRVNLALHGAWFLPGGEKIDALVGQGFRVRREPAFLAGSGLDGTATDIVSHLQFTPTPWADITTRQRFDRRSLKIRFAEALGSVGPSWARVTAGYTYSVTNPFFYYDTAPTSLLATTPRNEGVLGLSTQSGPVRFHASARRDLRQNKMVSLALGTSYEDECFIFDVSFFRRYTSINNDRGASTILFELTFKTVGQFGFHAL